MLIEIAAIVIGYLLGSIPAAYIVGKLRKGIDVRNVDSTGNMGAGSTFRQVGIWEGMLVGATDLAKGAVTIIIAQALGISELWVLGAGFAAILGHNFPVYVGFRGGQGIATIMGVFFILAPVAMAITTVLACIVVLITRRLFASVYVAAPTLPLFIWLFESSTVLIFYSLAILIYLCIKTLYRIKEVQAIFIKSKG